ncbi:hypothetical protein PDIG_33040 [Penicillium digitatum PHI26]|uniref:5'-3' DNA helicase ZGRF1-like N-terminal domain-containing protein n=2 Tax=Penicillium digitatum TaxID=36651 RepID=K9GID7_PEND2|nr:hypothetical protein PDIP_52600 [Penicillium digitatum Pd1]EKV12392.1 hypothetical protein PDIP_52600 [Penicillium digitatum Pd1]EKV14428.1 hypothetical protein PDIG_33040 [Penicillium digitatum PHI26]
MISTPSSSTRLPPTSPQVTASVVKFRCLYTHDLRRKSKRWHDGYLRYHKFNKRIMVYDDQGNFIGDHHWRSSDEVQDGDEMELDKGVLIEVTENMGTTETDITTLYEKKKSSQGSPQTKDPVSQAPCASTYTSASAPLRSSASSQSFRSLNDLLGIKRTPIGHLVSPYEERNPPRPASSIQETERAPKRQKTSSVLNRRPEKGSHARSEVIDLTDPTDSNRGLPVKQRLCQVVKELPRAGDNSTGDVFPANDKQRSAVQTKQNRPQRPNSPSLSTVSASTVSEPTFSLPRAEEVVHIATKGAQPPRSVGPSPKSSLIPTIPAETDITGPRGNLLADQMSINREKQSRVAPRPIPLQRSDPPTVSRSSPPIAPKQPSSCRFAPQPPVRVVKNYVKPIESANDQAATKVPPPADVSSPANVSLSVKIPPTANNSSSTKMPPPSRLSSVPHSEAPTAALRMGTGKPRRKLMYSALLPGISRTPSPANSDTPPGSATREPAIINPEQQSVYTHPITQIVMLIAL